MPAGSTTTIRIDRATHAALLELSQAAGAPLIDTVRDAAEALRRQRFAERVASEFRTLRADPDAWNDYLTDETATHVTDGLGR